MGLRAQRFSPTSHSSRTPLLTGDVVRGVPVLRSAFTVTHREMQDMAAREECVVEDALLPKTVEGLRFLVPRSMHGPPSIFHFFLINILFTTHF
jgi:hypothetical protein